jgi:RimJ/RimL family protein N-acetyltransferase
MKLETLRLIIELQTSEELLALISRLSPDERADVSPDSLARMRAVTEPDIWALGFKVMLREGGAVVGTVGFKTPPSAEGVVEIAYHIHADHQRRDIATEAVQAVIGRVLGSAMATVIRAHTLHGNEASKRVLAKCGFRFIGEVVEPDDGLVLRWERRAPAPDIAQCAQPVYAYGTAN